MGRIALLLSAVLISATAFGQDSKVILDKLSNKAKGYSTIDAQFTQRIVDKQSGIDQTQKGSIQLKGEKYKAVLGNYEIYSDGESLTTYDKELNEAMIDYLEDVEDGTLSPSKMFTIWEDNFKHELVGSEKVGATDCHKINLYPEDPKEKTYHTITMWVDKTKMEVTQVVVKGKDGTEMVYNITSFVTGKDLPDSTFTFSVKGHPGVEVIDNR
ncbi:MAG: LolA family protein [Flavobacteriales bacterium]